MTTPVTKRLARALAVAVAAVLCATVLPALPASAKTTKINASFFGMHDSDSLTWPVQPVGAIRLWDTSVTWRNIEVSPGVYDFTRLDALVNNALAHGLRPLIVLGQTPEFYATSTSVGIIGKGASSNPSSTTVWQQYVAAVASRYTNTADYQVWNEPNVIGYWRGSQAQMATLTRTAAGVINAFAPKATIVGPSFPIRLPAQQTWMSTFYKTKTGGKHVASYVDAVALSLYPRRDDGPEDSIALLRDAKKIFKKRHVKKPIWDTEINYGLVGNGSNAKHLGAKRQASYVVRTFALGAANNVKRTYWYAWDLQKLASVELTKSNDTSRTRAGIAYGVVRGWLLNTRVTGCSVTAGTYTCTAKYSGGVRRIYWNPHHKATITTHKGATYYQSMNGTQKHVKGKKPLKVNYAPIMVRSKH